MATRVPSFTLSHQGIDTPASLHWNLETAPLDVKTVCRGDGMLAASRSRSRTQKAADESETTVAHSSKAGLVADKDTLGALAQQKASLERSTASGVKTGTQAALDGKVTWKLTTVKG